jgi:DNA gyrase subunit B
MSDLQNNEPTPNGVATSSDYSGSSFQMLQNADHIRKRPGMYIGDTTSHGLHHLVYELVYNSVDEALAGYCKTIHVLLKSDGSVSVADDGRGIPVDIHPEAGKPTLEVALTVTGTGAKFDKGSYKVSSGLHGMGAKAVTALSEWTEAEVRRDGRVYRQEYERGKATTEVRDIGAGSARTGTTITFKPDPEIFHDAAFSYDTLESRLRELAFLNKGLAIKLTEEGTGKEEQFNYQGGIGEFVSHLNRSEEVLHPIVYLDRTVLIERVVNGEKVEEPVRVEVALQYTTSEEERVRCYTNNAYNPGGGTHSSGFRSAITRTINAFGTKENLFKGGTEVRGEDTREGLTAVVSVQVSEPQFESNNKIRLNNPEVEGIVSSAVSEHLAKYLEENPKEAQKIMRKVDLAAQAREAAAKAKKDLKERKSILSGGGLPGKLMDCTSRDRKEAELFVVEGNSAGGSAESGRDRLYQAILPLRGKPLNVEKAKKDKLLHNEEIRSLISAIGIDIGNSDTLDGLRYNKIVILADADVDGQHIRTLLLTFFYRQMQKLLADGHIYVARPPLYKVSQKKDVRYVQTVAEMNSELLKRGLKDARLRVRPPVDPTSETPASEVENVFEGERLAALVKLLDEMEGPLVSLERRGLNLADFFKKAGPQGLPTHRVVLAAREYWFASLDAVAEFQRLKQAELGRELVVADDALRKPDSPNGNGHAAEPQGLLISQQELHEVKTINKQTERLREYDLKLTDLLPAPRVAGREPPPRFFFKAGDSEKVMPHLRELVGDVRKAGEKGLTITRFKGLGEMDGEELWDTTLDPEHRSLLRVHMEDGAAAETLFRMLMGEEVQERRKYIQEHALNVKDIDYHGA